MAVRRQTLLGLDRILQISDNWHNYRWGALAQHATHAAVCEAQYNPVQPSSVIMVPHVPPVAATTPTLLPAAQHLPPCLHTAETSQVEL